ncbi:nuclear transport factor 2 family protein [Streptomyces sp. NBC_00237]|uniref:nuclear transport factor 2 family protein n=1 Tax=Streptomyces sp. NBC_00237 TaxID=2975687 RepID=UPI002255948E|nr:nuclear transport factor 2 family protein [Streptomyces sp. NBC_00237]MCX5203232.1 nuclear transport factor 2 family protein [Streptomyces sp. NBC_00237]
MTLPPPTLPAVLYSAPADLEERVRTLEDRAHLTDLLDRFTYGLDTPGPLTEGWYRSLLTENLRLNLPNGTHQGIDGLPGFMNDAKTKWAVTQHYATNCVIDIDPQGDQASMRANVHAVHVPHGGPAPLFTGGAHYDVRAERTPEGWRMAELSVTVRWTSDGGHG